VHFSEVGGLNTNPQVQEHDFVDFPHEINNDTEDGCLLGCIAM
jgi:hypothetical protein